MSHRCTLSFMGMPVARSLFDAAEHFDAALVAFQQRWPRGVWVLRG